MNARIDFCSGRTEKGKRLGCVDGQFFAQILDLSRRDANGYYPTLFCTGPQDSETLATKECQEWAAANGITISGLANLVVNTGAEADIRANR